MRPTRPSSRSADTFFSCASVQRARAREPRHSSARIAALPSPIPAVPPELQPLHRLGAPHPSASWHLLQSSSLRLPAPNDRAHSRAQAAMPVYHASPLATYSSPHNRQTPLMRWICPKHGAGGGCSVVGLRSAGAGALIQEVSERLFEHSSPHRTSRPPRPHRCPTHSCAGTCAC